MELYNIFINAKYNDLLTSLKTDYKLKEDTNDYNKIKTYLNSMPMIYGNENARSTAFSSHIAESDQEEIENNKDQISIEEENSSENNNNKEEKEEKNMIIESEIDKENNFINNDINFSYIRSNIDSDNINSGINNFINNNNFTYIDENNADINMTPNINLNGEINNLNNSFEKNNQDIIKIDKNQFNII